MVIDTKTLLMEYLVKNEFGQLDNDKQLIMIKLYGWYRDLLPIIFPGEGWEETSMEEVYEATIEPTNGEVIDYMSKLIKLSGKDITQLSDKQLKIREGLNRWRLNAEC